MTVVAKLPLCPGCGEYHTAHLGIFLYLCEEHALACQEPRYFIDVDSLNEQLVAAGFEGADFEHALWEYNPLPPEIATRPN